MVKAIPLANKVNIHSCQLDKPKYYHIISLIWASLLLLSSVSESMHFITECHVSTDCQAADFEKHYHAPHHNFHECPFLAYHIQSILYPAIKIPELEITAPETEIPEYNTGFVPGFTGIVNEKRGPPDFLPFTQSN